MSKHPAGSGAPCSNGQVTATGSFTTNGAGGTVYYGWVRTDGQKTTIQPEQPIVIAAGDYSPHAVVSDQWTPQHSGSEQLVFVYPAYSVQAQSWTCRG